MGTIRMNSRVMDLRWVGQAGVLKAGQVGQYIRNLCAVD